MAQEFITYVTGSEFQQGPVLGKLGFVPVK
jgi:hypothetical protein